MGVTLLICALLAQPSPEAGAPPVASVKLRVPIGSDRKLLDGIEDLITVRRGQALSHRQVTRSIESLFATQRFSDVVVRVLEGPGGVEVAFDVTPRLKVRSVYVDGAQAFTPKEVAQLSGLEPGSEYWPERVTQAAEAVIEGYRRHGYVAARVSPATDLMEDGVEVGFTVVEGEPSRFTSVAFTGEPGVELPALTEALGITAGEVLDLGRIEKGLDAVRALLRERSYFRARVEDPVVLEGGRVVVPLQAGPRYEVVFSGNHSVADHALRAVLAYDGQELLDLGLAARLAWKLNRFYRFRGFHDVRVTPREVLRPGTRQAALGFDIEEGLPLRVVRVDFVGTQVITPAELREVLTQVVDAATPVAPVEAHRLGDPVQQEGRGRAAGPTLVAAPPPSTVFDEQAWADATRAMGALYRERGYLSATVRLEGVELKGEQARARFVVSEGPRTVLRDLKVRGLPAGFESAEVASQHRGDVFGGGALEALKQTLLRELGRKGYLFASVKTHFEVDPTGRYADADLAVDAGPMVRARKVLPVGNVRTADDVILARATMEEGEPLDAESLFKTQAALMALGIFRTVEVETLSPEVKEPLKTVLLKVREAPRLSGEVGLGYFVADGPRIVVDGSAPNLWGRAINLAGHLQVNFFALSAPALSKQVDVSDLQAVEQIGGRGNVSLTSRLPGNFALRLDVVGERVFRQQFHFTRFAGIPGATWSRSFEVPHVEWAHPELTLQLQYELEWAHPLRTGSSVTTVLPLTLVDQERLRFIFGTFTMETVRFTPTLDLRDNAISPRKGFLLQGNVEYTGALAAYVENGTSGGGQPVPVQFIKASGLLSGYVPISSKIVLALSARAGRIFALVKGSVTPPVKRFFLGGATSMRGFNEDQLVAEYLRKQYQEEVHGCQVLAVHDGCTSAAKTIQAGGQVPSQGGELFALFKSELRFPAFGALDLGLFMEAGNLWLGVPSTFPLRVIVGSGLRYVTPMGPLAIDLGVNLAPDQIINEPRVVVHFNIGVF